MRFRFHIEKTLRLDPPLNPLSEWATAPIGLGGSPVAWTLGANPTVTITGPYPPFGGKTTQYLYIEFPFTVGRSYQLNFDIDHVDNTGFPQNPRTLIISIQNQSGTNLTSESYATNPGTNNLVFNFTAGAGYVRIAVRFNSGSGRTMTVLGAALSVTAYEFHDSYINEPDGWKNCTLKLDRDKVFHSLIEHFEGSFIFYGDNGTINGGYHILKDWDLQDGPDADITLTIEYTDNNTEFFEIFSGQLDMSLAEWMIDHKVRIPIIKDSFWATFMNRKETPVNLIAADDLDDVGVEELVDDIRIDLPSQKIRYNGEYRWADSFTYDLGSEALKDFIIQVDWDTTVVDDVRKFNLPRAAVEIVDDSVRPIGLFEAPWDGDYTFDVKLEGAYYDQDTSLWHFISSSGAVVFALHPDSEYSQRGENGFINDANSHGSDSTSVHTYNKTLKLFKGQQVVVYGQVGTAVSPPFNKLTIFGERRLIWRDVRLATTTAIVLSGEKTIDGEMTSSDRVLVKNQGDPAENGVYVSSAGAWVRATDSDTSIELIDAAVYVTDGDNNSESGWRQIEETVDIGVTGNSWVYIIPNDERIRPYPGDQPVENYFKVTADTTFKKTQSPAFLLHDAAAAILKHYGLGYSNPFYSEVLGSDRTLSRQYDENGCFWPYGLTRGLQLRGYSLVEKSFAMSFMEWWQGVNPIFNLGLGYEFIPGSTVVPEVVEVAAMADWEDAEGDHPGTWTYTSPAVPHVSVNGDGEESGYTVGAVATVTGETYNFSMHLQIYETGGGSPSIEVTVAILDGSFNEIETVEFSYTTYGNKVENFNLTPNSDGVYIGVNIVNNTPTDTKTFSLWNVVSIDRAGFTPETWTPVSGWGAVLVDANSFWSYDPTNPFLTANASHPGGTYSDLYKPAATQTYEHGQIYHYRIDFTIQVISGTDEISVRIVALDSLAAEIFFEEKTIAVTSGVDYTGFVDFMFLGNPDIKFVGIDAYYNDSSTSGSVLTIDDQDDLTESVPDGGEITIDDETRIRVEKLEYFYDPEPVVFLSNIREITRRYDTEKIYKKILIGYKQWKTEDISGIDDPQTKHTYATQLKKSGEEIEVLSEFIGASLAIEQARRQSIDKSTDYQFDDSTFIIALNSEFEDVSPDSFTPELDENFTVINNLLNSETRYNIRITPKRNFLRHINWFNVGLQSYIGSLYRFTRGEGNYDVETAMLSSCEEEDYGSDLLSEGQNLTVTSDAIHTSYYYEIEYPLSLSTYKSISLNKNKAIGVSQTDFDHIPLLIDTLAYQLAKGTVQISGWTKEYWDITAIIGNPPTQDCVLNVECENPITDSFSNILADEEGNCIVWA
jgi:hypothetical protein